MNLLDKFCQLVISFWSSILSLFDSITFRFFGFQVSLLGVLFSFIVLSMVISMFWKGARA